MEIYNCYRCHDPIEGEFNICEHADGEIYCRECYDAVLEEEQDEEEELESLLEDEDDEYPITRSDSPLEHLSIIDDEDDLDDFDDDMDVLSSLAQEDDLELMDFE